MTALLGIDLGTGSVKALVVDERGRTLGSGHASYPLRHPQPGWAEQEPEEWWRAAIVAVRMARLEAGNPRIAAIGLSGQMHGTVVLDEHRQVLRPAIIWADTRSASEAEEITRRIGRERLIEIAGSPVAAGFQAATLVWVQRREPHVWDQTRSILLPKDYLRLRLTGELVAEPSDASSTLLLDVRSGDWSDQILRELDVPRERLPRILPSTQLSGGLTAEAAAAFDLPEGTPVAGGGGDAPLAALAAGVVSEDRMALTISSGSQVIVPTGDLRLDPAGRIHSWRGALAGVAGASTYYQMGATMVSGMAMRWLAESIFALRSRTPDRTLARWAADVPAGSGGLLFLPYLTGERTPHMDPRARGAFFGLTAEHGRGHLVRAAMEGTTFAVYDAFGVLASLGARPASIVLCGGGAQSALWRQVAADVFALPVWPLLTVEQSALGAALLAGAGIGLVDPVAAARQWATYGDPVEPNPAATEVYARLLPIFRRLYSLHVADFAALSVLVRGGE